MKNMLLATGLMVVTSSAFAHVCGFNAQYCVSFEDQLEHPTMDGFLMQHTVITPDGVSHGPHTTCANAGMNIVVKLNDEGKYIEYWKFVKTDDQGNTQYVDFAANTLYVSEAGRVHPARNHMMFDGSMQPNCTMTPPPGIPGEPGIPAATSLELSY